MVPHLITALTGPINELEQRVLDSMPAIERWFRLEWMEHTPPFYSSVDIRNSGFKLAPVDTNLYPDGWHNLTPEMLPLAVQAAMAAIEKICPEAKNLLLIPENHAHNSFYLSNLAQLRRIFHMAGLNVRIGSINPEIKQNTTVSLPNGESVTLEPVQRVKGRLMLKHFDPCTILLNNDLSAGVPGILEDLHEQYLLPPLHGSWPVRRKSRHFRSYEEVAKRFGKLLGVDPWLINPMFGQCGEVDFSQDSGMDCLRSNVDALLTKIRRKYKEYGIPEKPFVVVKADNVAAGAGLITVRDVKALDVLQAGARQNASAANEVIVQEGVLTCERMHDAVAEPVVYMMDRYVVGGFYRIHAERGVDEDLSAPGSSFVPLAFEHSTHLPQPGVKPGASAPNRFYMYGVIGRLAMLAASYELEATDPDAEVFQ
jgi:glutamate--cysteine ligase